MVASVDVVVPNYQYGRYLRECVTSILTQDVLNLRVLIIDNASTDNSVEIARQIASEDARVELVVHRKNLGPHASYNEGTDWASADYFLIVDADDLLAPGCLARAIAIMESNAEICFTYGVEAYLLPSGVIRTGAPVADEAQWHVSTGREFLEQACRTAIIPSASPTVVRRTSAQKRVGHYRPELPYSDDQEMWLRLATIGAVAETTAVQAIRRLHDGQVSAHYRSDQLRDFVERKAAFGSFFANEGKSVPEARQLMRQVDGAFGAHAYWSALSHLCRGHWSVGLRLLSFSLKHRPSAVLLPPVDWLFRIGGAYERVIDVLSEAIARGHGKPNVGSWRDLR